MTPGLGTVFTRLRPLFFTTFSGHWRSAEPPAPASAHRTLTFCGTPDENHCCIGVTKLKCFHNRLNWLQLSRQEREVKWWSRPIASSNWDIQEKWSRNSQAASLHLLPRWAQTNALLKLYTCNEPFERVCACVRVCVCVCCDPVSQVILFLIVAPCRPYYTCNYTENMRVLTDTLCSHTLTMCVIIRWLCVALLLTVCDS